MKKTYLFILFFISFVGFGQRISNLNVFIAGTGVSIKFTITKGTSCNGYNILYSSDSINYTPIYNFPGICGNTSTDENITYLHATPKVNANNYYKVELIPIELSLAKKIFVPEIPNVDALVYPNPIVAEFNQLKFRILNTNNTKLSGYIYNQAGIPLRVLDVTTVFDIATIDVNELKNDTYLISLSSTNKTYTFKFIVIR